MSRKRLLIVAALLVGFVLVGQLLSSTLFGEPPPPEPPEPPAPTASVPEPPPEPAPEVARVEQVEGAVERSDGERWTKVQVGDVLEASDGIRTGPSSRAVLGIGNTARVEMGERSEFAVEELSRTVSRLRLGEGRLQAVVQEGGGALRVEAKGSDAVAESKGGSFSMLSTGKGEVAVAAQTGRVRFSAKGKSIEMTGGEQSISDATSGPSDPTPIPSTLFLKVQRPRSTLQREREARISGEASPGAVISINGVRVGAAEDGTFSAVVPLQEGVNAVEVAAEDASGRTTAESLPPITVKSKVAPVKGKVTWGGGAK